MNFCFATAERRAREKKILVFISPEFMLFGVWFAGKVEKFCLAKMRQVRENSFINIIYIFLFPSFIFLFLV